MWQSVKQSWFWIRVSKINNNNSLLIMVVVWCYGGGGSQSLVFGRKKRKIPFLRRLLSIFLSLYIDDLRFNHSVNDVKVVAPVILD